MGIRNTFSMSETFVQILSDCKEQKTKVLLVLHLEGMLSTEGFVKEIYSGGTRPYIELQSGTKIALSTIVGVNGLFAPSFSEC